MDVTEKVFWIWLSSVPSIGAKRFKDLVDIFKTPKNVWSTPDRELNRYIDRLGRNSINNIIQYRQDKYLRDAKKTLHREDISVITLIEDEYPPRLKSLYAPPPVLYVKGRLPAHDMNTVAIVGSRRATYYGKQVAEKLAYELGQAGVAVVSGLAYGIDAMAHKGALRTDTPTVGVLGCGVDIVYPQQNLKYYKEMAKRGAIISEYPPGTKPLSGNFPARNRIISGLSQGVLVVEARQRSGALITVDFALEQGRDVFAIPGNINQPCSYGPNSLIKEGAKLVTRVEDILDELPGYIKSKQDRLPPVQLDFLESQVYNVLDSHPKHIDEIANITGMNIGQLNSVLTKLEIKRAIKRLPGKLFIRLI